MNGIANLAPLTPIVAGLVVRYLISRRDGGPLDEPGILEDEDVATPRVFMYPRGIVKAIFASAIFLPLVFILLPDSVVQDARPLFNLGAVLFGAALLFAWAYLYKYKILVTRDEIRYGAFKVASIDLSHVTSIRYFWVDNGINLKLFSKNKRIDLFEGGIENFDAFAKVVRRRLPQDAQVETIGKASF
jgi:hypothetical protein